MSGYGTMKSSEMILIRGTTAVGHADYTDKTIFLSWNTIQYNETQCSQTHEYTKQHVLGMKIRNTLQCKTATR